MPKQIGIIKLDGTIGDVSFYKRKGEYLARHRGGPTRNMIMTKPSFKTVRENLSEFGGASKIASCFTKSLKHVKEIKDGELHYKIVKVMHAMMKRSDGIKGQRPYQITKHRNLFKNIEMNSSLRLDQVLTASFQYSHNDERFSAITSAEKFQPAEKVVAPSGASHFRLVQAMFVTSDCFFSERDNQYLFSDSHLNQKSVVTRSDHYPVDSKEEIVITINSMLQDIPLLTDSVSVFQCLGIQFAEKIGDQYYPFSGGAAMKIVDVF